MSKRIEVMLTVDYDPESGDLSFHISQAGRPGDGSDDYNAHRRGETAAFGRDLTATLLGKLGWKQSDANHSLAQEAR